MIPLIHLLIVYDCMSRLREVKEYSSGAVCTNTTRYMWNGWELKAELDESNTIKRTYTWGVDMSGTVGGFGGIGGLLACRNPSQNETVYYNTDMGGNVVGTYSTNAVSSYTYGPYGEIISADDQHNQPFSYQTKMRHPRSGLVYFGYRWYTPQQKRWLNRDPLGEAGGLNLYSYCSENPVNFFDALGLFGELMIMTIADGSRTKGYVTGKLRKAKGQAIYGCCACGTVWGSRKGDAR